MYKNYTKKLVVHNAYVSKILLIMRLTTVLLIATFMQVSAASFAQKINLNRSNASLKTIIKELRNQSGYDFVYTDDQLAKANSVTIKVSNMPVEDVLTLIFKDQPLSYTIDTKTIAIIEKERTIIDKIRDYFLNIDVSGKIVDENGKGLTGASVKVKNSTKITTTDDQGNFKLANVDEDAIIVVSFIGYQSIEIKAAKDLGTITLKISVSDLSEIKILNTGYQRLLKERSSGTIEHIDQEILANRPATDLSAALDGVVAGMQAVQTSDGRNSFIIRGISTLTSSNNQRAPLIVVDGFPLASADFSTINPNDVLSVDVLKDAAASAVWGARATNGVIVITTKKGAGKNGLNIDASVFLRVAPRPDLNQINPIATSAQTIAYEQLALSRNIYGTTAYQGGVFPGEFTRPLTLAQEFIFNNKFRGLSTSAMNASLDSLSRIDNRSQINNLLLQNTMLQQYNVSLNSNNDRSKTYSSLLFENNQDRYVGNGYKRFNLNFDNEYKLSKDVTFKLNAFVRYNAQKSSGATLNEIRNISPYETLLKEDGTYSTQINMYNRHILSQLPLSRFPYADLSYNMLREMRGRDLETKDYYARIQAGLEINILKGLTLDSKIQYERGKTDVENFYSDDTFYVRQMVDNFTAYNNTTKVVGNSLLPKGGILQTQNNNQTNYNFRSQLNFIKDISKISINATVGGEISQARSEGRINPWLYGYNPQTRTSIVPPYGYGSAVDNFTAATITGANTNSLNGGTTTLSYGLDRFVSYFGASNITYNNKYTLSLNIRGDASNYITSISSLRWSPFWSVGGNWNIKAENFLTNTDWVNSLILRASYGSTGTADKSTSTEALLNVTTAPNTATGTLTATVSSYGNPFLRWERTYSTNIGLDFGILASKLFGSINWYDKKGRDITGSINLPSVYGTQQQTFNSADLVNQGIEIQLGTQANIARDFRYNTSINYAYNWNRITKLYFPTQPNNTLVTGGGFVQGRPVNAYYTYNYAGVNAAGQPQIYGPNNTKNVLGGSVLYFNTDGLTNGYLNYAGTRTPPHTMGWRNTFTYRNLSLTAQITGTFGATFLNPSFAYTTYIGSSKTIVSRFVEQPLAGGDNVVPFPTAADGGTALASWINYTPYLTHHIESSSYIQLKELFLNYQLPKSLLGKAKLRNASIYIQARDLGMLWENNTFNYHPEFLPGTNRPLQTFTFGAKFGL